MSFSSRRSHRLDGRRWHVESLFIISLGTCVARHATNRVRSDRLRVRRRYRSCRDAAAQQYWIGLHRHELRECLASLVRADRDGTIQIHLLYDHERASPNRAAGHIHLRLHGSPGAKLTLEFRNLDNVWNGTPASVASELKTLVISEDGRDWKPVSTESLPGNRVRLTVVMPGPTLYVARLEPYRLSDLDRLLGSIRNNPRVRNHANIGRTAGGRDLEIIQIGAGRAPYRVFLRARAHPWESGSSWIAQGLVQRLLKEDAATKGFLERYTVYILPMANKDGVARGMTRFNGRGKDLNRNWDKPADRDLYRKTPRSSSGWSG